MTSFVGAKANRNNSIGGLSKVPGKQLEEFHLSPWQQSHKTPKVSDDNLWEY
ncbi:MAG: hypothetical protein ACI9XK_002171 [Granulosicoccus sp.]|jgi:hypothetical protein